MFVEADPAEVRRALEAADWDYRVAAQALGLSQKGIRQVMRDHGVYRHSIPDPAIESATLHTRRETATALGMKLDEVEAIENKIIGLLRSSARLEIFVR